MFVRFMELKIFLVNFLLQFFLGKCCHPRVFSGAGNVQFLPLGIGTFPGPRPIILPQSQWPFFNNPFFGLPPAQLFNLLATNPALLNNPYFLQAFLPGLNTFQLTGLLTQSPMLLTASPGFTSALVSFLNPAQLGALLTANPTLLSYPNFIQSLSGLPLPQLAAFLNSPALSPQIRAQLLANPLIQQTLTTQNAASSNVQAVQQTPQAQANNGNGGNNNNGIQKGKE